MRMLNAARIVGLCFAWVGLFAQAQTPVTAEWPNKAIKIVVTYPTAG